jgi:hypothetical protein
MCVSYISDSRCDCIVGKIAYANCLETFCVLFAFQIELLNFYGTSNMLWL